MGVKSTNTLTREVAERCWVDAKLAVKRAKYAHKVTKLSNHEIENQLEKWSDEANAGQGFTNFLITHDGN